MQAYTGVGSILQENACQIKVSLGSSGNGYLCRSETPSVIEFIFQLCSKIQKAACEFEVLTCNGEAKW